MFPTGLNFAEKHLHLTGRITSYFYLGISLSNMLTAWVIGQFFERSGPFSLIVILSMLVAAELVVWVLIRLATRQQPTHPEETH
jgi:predicted MFS family arabinose efflux permease